MKERQNQTELMPKGMHEHLESLYTLINVELFEGDLNKCSFSLSRRSPTLGYVPFKWASKNNKHSAMHEITLSPTALKNDIAEFCALMVHQMCHLWQHQFGSPSRKGYHNRQWAAKMLSLGMLPTDNGRADGKMTGQSITQIIVDHGRMMKLLDKFQDELSEMSLVLTSYANHKKSLGGSITSKKKQAYRCQLCGLVVWGKEGLTLRCTTCDQELHR